MLSPLDVGSPIALHPEHHQSGTLASFLEKSIGDQEVTSMAVIWSWPHLPSSLHVKLPGRKESSYPFAKQRPAALDSLG